MLVLEWKERAFIEKVNSRCFCWFPAAILVDQNGTPIWRLHTKLYKGVLNVSANNSETVGHKDLNLGQIVYILVFYNISCSWHLPLDGFQCIFLLRDSETIYTFFRLACKNVSSCRMQRECTSWQISFWGHSCSVVKIFFTVHIICRNVVFCKELVGSAVVCNISCRWCYLVQYWESCG